MSVDRAVRSASHAELFRRATAVTPGGVHSPVRAFRSVGAPPIAIVEARGARVWDAEGREYIDWIGAWGPALLGHAHPAIVGAVQRAAERGLVFGLASPPEVELAERVTARVPGCEQVRFTTTGTEAAMAAVRIARAATQRSGIIKFDGGYHGHGDGFLIRAGSGAATLGIPDSPGVTAGAASDTYVARYNDLDDVDRCFEQSRGSIAAVIVEPVVGNMGCVPPAPGFLEALRELTGRHGALLIFDDVMTGFRVALGGAQQRFGINPDLTTLGKIIGGGLPIAAYGGRADIMRKVAPLGPVYQAGTLSGNPLSVAAGLAMLRYLIAHPELYEQLETRAAHLTAWNPPGVTINRVGSMYTFFFSPDPVTDWDSAKKCDIARFGKFFHFMLDRGVYLAPSQFEAAFLSTAHSEQDVRYTVAAAQEFFSS
jgi:glutamate-1-semialdehyde 2,1-aminomutase